MKVVPLAEVKSQFREYLDRSKREPIFITRNGRIAAVLEGMTDGDMEDYLLERSSRFRKMIKSAKNRRGGVSLEAYRKSRGL